MIESSGPATDYAARRSAERRRAQRALGPALIVSAALHVVALLVIGFHVDFHPARPAPSAAAPADPIMRAYDIAAVSADVAPIETQLRERELQRETPVERPWTATQGTPAPADATGAARQIAPDRLQYRMGDPEIWRPQAPTAARELTDEERVQERIASQLRVFNDSVAAEEALRARGLDWTIKDANGNKWGVSPGKIHLGSIEQKFSIELPRSEELTARQQTWTEIQLQAGRVETQSIFNDRVKAIRERADQERARRNATGTATAGPPAGAAPGGTGTGAAPGGGTGTPPGGTGAAPGGTGAAPGGTGSSGTTPGGGSTGG